MIKSVLKILYIAFGLILAVLIYIIGYNSNGFNYILKITNKAIKQQDYTEVALIHGGCLDKRSLVEDQTDLLDMAIFPSTTLSATTYYSEEEKKTENSYDNSYYIYIFNPKFELIDVQTTEYINSSGVKFYDENENSFVYEFKITNDINAKKYVAKPSTKEEALLYGERNLFNGYDSWGFFNITLTSDMIEAMNLKNITSLAVLDSGGNEVYTQEVSLDFSQEFFSDVAPLVEHYNIYIEEANSSDKEISKNAEDKFNEFYGGENGFEAQFKQIENYSFRHSDKYLQPTSLIWQTIGIVALYLVCAFLLYMLLFHFAFLKSLVSRDGRLHKNPGASRKRKMLSDDGKAANGATKKMVSKNVSLLEQKGIVDSVEERNTIVFEPVDKTDKIETEENETIVSNEKNEKEEDINE